MVTSALLLAFALACAPTDAPTRGSAPPSAPPFTPGANLPAFEGTVAERLPAGGYLYLRVGDQWVASIDKPIGVGERVRVRPIGVARDFQSRRLGRRFDALVFGLVTPST